MRVVIQCYLLINLRLPAVTHGKNFLTVANRQLTLSLTDSVRRISSHSVKSHLFEQNPGAYLRAVGLLRQAQPGVEAQELERVQITETPPQD